MTENPTSGLPNINLMDLALPQDFTALAPTSVQAAAPDVRKPSSQWWFAFSDRPGDRRVFPILEMKDDRESFVVVPQLRDALAGEWHPMLLVLCQTREGTFFLCPIRVPNPDGKIDNWNRSAHVILAEHSGKWIRRMSDMQAGGYRVATPESELKPPVWPDSSDKLFEDALRDRVISSLDHPAVKKLKGAA